MFLWRVTFSSNGRVRSSASAPFIARDACVQRKGEREREREGGREGGKKGGRHEE